MDALIALMPESPALLCSPTGTAALARLFAAVGAARTLDRVLAVGHDPALLALAENAGLPAVLLAAPKPLHAKGLLPSGGAEALASLGVEDRRTLLVSCANPLLTGQVIDAFVRRAEEENRPLLSAIAPLDHPCQLSQHLRMREAGVLLPLEPKADDDGRRSTKPFRFLWTAQQTRGDGPLFTLDASSDQGLLLSVPDCAPKPGFGPLLRRESEDSARLSVSGGELAQFLAPFGLAPRMALADGALVDGALADGALDDGAITHVGLHLTPGVACAVFHGAEGGQRLGFAAGAQQRQLCQLYATRGQNGQAAELRASLNLEGQPPSAALPWSAQELEGPVSYNLLEYLEQDGGFDLALAFPDEGHGLWCVDPATSCRINTASGRVIHGRQEFPEVLEPDGSLFALTRGEASQFDALLHAGETTAFVLERSQSLVLNTRFDMLRYQAKLRMEET